MTYDENSIATEYDGTFRRREPMDVEWLVAIAAKHHQQYVDTAFISMHTNFSEEHYPTEVQMEPHGLLEIAPIEEWSWGEGNSAKWCHLAWVIHRGVTFFANMTAKQKELIEKEGQLRSSEYRETKKWTDALGDEWAQ